jgi:hypothetical protein
VKSTNYEAPPYTAFSTLLSLYPSLVQIFTSAPCSQTPSVYFAVNTVIEKYEDIVIPLKFWKIGIHILHAFAHCGESVCFSNDGDLLCLQLIDSAAIVTSGVVHK